MNEKLNFKEPKAAQFANSLIDTFNKSAPAFILSIGPRTLLFDTMSEMDESTSEEIADKASR